MNEIERFLSFVNKESNIYGKYGNYPTQCWIWTGFKEPKRGYGRFTCDHEQYAHRFSFVTYNGRIEDDKQVHHKCEYTACVNPDHLSLESPRKNTLLNNGGPAINARKIYCDHGHRLLGINLFVYKDGRRDCYRCIANRSCDDRTKDYIPRFCRRNHEKNDYNTIYYLDENKWINKCIECMQTNNQRYFSRIKHDDTQYIDIILPTINRPSLKNSIESIINQNFKNWILYVIGDGHEPNNDIVDDRIIYTKLPYQHNDNGAHARNIGISIGHSKWIAYNDCDDIWLPNHLETMQELGVKNPEANMFRTAGQAFYWKHKSPRSSKLVRKLGAVNSTDILTPSMCHTRELFQRSCSWQNGTAHDKDLWNDMIKNNGIPAITDRVTFEFER